MKELHTDNIAKAGVRTTASIKVHSVRVITARMKNPAERRINKPRKGENHEYIKRHIIISYIKESYLTEINGTTAGRYVIQVDHREKGEQRPR